MQTTVSKTTEATFWAFEQAQYLTSTQTLLLVYLATYAFVSEPNSEKAPASAVMRHYSKVETMMKHTGIKSRDTVRKALNELQGMGYIWRQERIDPELYGQQPHVIFVLWDAGDVQQSIRDGGMIPPELLVVPGKKHSSKPRPKTAPRHLQVVRSGSD